MNDQERQQELLRIKASLDAKRVKRNLKKAKEKRKAEAKAMQATVAKANQASVSQTPARTTSEEDMTFGDWCKAIVFLVGAVFIIWAAFTGNLPTPSQWILKPTNKGFQPMPVYEVPKSQ